MAARAVKRRARDEDSDDEAAAGAGAGAGGAGGAGGKGAGGAGGPPDAKRGRTGGDPVKSDSASVSSAVSVEKPDYEAMGRAAAKSLKVDGDKWMAMTHNQRAEIRLKVVRAKRKGAPVRCYADGIFDMFHYGHARALEQAKNSLPNSFLVVGCCNDELTHRLKGRTVMKDTERYESLRHCKWVDEIVTSAPWFITDEFMEEHDIDFVCHDALPYGAPGTDATADIYYPFKVTGRFWETQRTEGVSTSELIIRIIKDYDEFVRRNLSRGHSASEMNVPFMKEKALQLDMAFDRARSSIKEVFSGSPVARGVGEKMDEIQAQFVELFGKNSSLRTKLRQARGQLTALARESIF
mmetsp:Transcript_27719/g.95921  ORF Transcript_27719/g.95921 Transcript_27719/m.95921 type:complete len:352 (-) Transcript_27719:125-1180(-)